MIISQGNWQVKRVSSTTGPLDGTLLSDAIRSSQSVVGQTEVLWSATEGWKAETSYRFHITHRPNQGLIRAKLWVGDTLIADSGDIIDNGPDSLKGGRLGVYCDSQENIIWSALMYRYLMV